MKLILRSIGLLISIALITSCAKSLTKGKYAEGIVKSSSYNPSNGLLKVIYSPENLPKNFNPIHGLHYTQRGDFKNLKYNDTIHFEVFKRENVVYASNVEKGKIPDNKERYKGVFHDHDVIDLHIEGLNRKDNQAHSKVHIINFYSEIFSFQNSNYKKTEVRLIDSGSNNVNIMYLAQDDIESIELVYDTSNPSLVHLSFVQEQQGNTIANASLTHDHIYENRQ